MILTDDERRMRDGAEGAAVAAAMGLLVRFGQALQAEGRGEHCAWMESSAVVYANSVLGARTNCEGGASTGAASLTGRIPCWGNHHDTHRRGTHLVRVDTPVASFRDWGLLGYAVGDVVQE